MFYEGRTDSQNWLSRLSQSTTVDVIREFVSTHSKKLIIFGYLAFLVCTVFVLTFATHYFYLYNGVIDRHLQGDKWAMPSTIYAEAPTLFKGQEVSTGWLINYLKRVNYNQTEPSAVSVAQFSAVPEGILFRKNKILSSEKESGTVFVKFNKNRIDKLVDLETNQEYTSYELEPAPIADLIDTDWEKRLLVELNQVPSYLLKAVITTEDIRFYQHHGIDLIGTVRALTKDIFGNGPLQGGSTITQQLVKNFYLTPERSIKRKLSEAAMALVMEKKISKKEILELYLNEIYYGQRGGMSINGVGAASRLFFNKDVRNLDVPEAALLAGMIPAPTLYDPYKHPDKAKQRRNFVLFKLRKAGVITSEQYERFIKTPIKVQEMDTSVNLAPYFGDLVEAQLESKYDTERIYKENLHIFTTIDLDMQQAAEEALTEGLSRIDKFRYKRVKKEVQGCLIAIEPKTGYVRAFVGGRNYSKSQFDRISQASRQPGSVFKPIVYAMALERAFEVRDRIFTTASLVLDEPVTFQDRDKIWEPKNYDGVYHGIVNLRQALAKSMNVATARLGQEVGLANIATLAKAMGLKGVRAYPSLALGTFEVSPWQMIEAYTVFANEGRKTELQTVKRVTDSEGKVLERGRVEVQQVIHPETAYIITDMLKGVLTSGTGASARNWALTKPVAGKTGTTDEYRDAWFIGYSPNLICLVWVGYDDNTPLKMNGAQAALPIWATFMKRAMQNLPTQDFSMPPGIVAKLIDPTTGKLATSACPVSNTELFIEGTEPTEICSDEYHYSPQLITDPLQPVIQQLPAETTQEVSYWDRVLQQQALEEKGESDQWIYIAPPPR